MRHRNITRSRTPRFISLKGNKDNTWSLRVGFNQVLKECHNFKTALYWAEVFQEKHMEEWGYKIPIKFVGDTAGMFKEE